MFDWNRSCSYDKQQKRRFHTTARSRLKKLVAELALPPGSFDLRSNRAGIAVSGEITLHHDRTYIQVGQFGLSSGHGILIRTCKGRKDYTSGGQPLRRSRRSPACAPSRRRRQAEFDAGSNSSARPTLAPISKIAPTACCALRNRLLWVTRRQVTDEGLLAAAVSNAAHGATLGQLGVCHFFEATAQAHRQHLPSRPQWDAVRCGLSRQWHAHRRLLMGSRWRNRYRSRSRSLRPDRDRDRSQPAQRPTP